MRKYEAVKYCAFCGNEIHDEYFRYRDNFLQMKYFDEPDGSDNIFCSRICAGEALMLDIFYGEKEEP
jgi:hypothetical protein